MGESRAWSQSVLPLRDRQVIELPPIEWSRLPACYRPRPAARHRRHGKPGPAIVGRQWTRQTLPAKTARSRRLLAADPIALAQELLIRYRAHVGN